MGFVDVGVSGGEEDEEEEMERRKDGRREEEQGKMREMAERLNLYL